MRTRPLIPASRQANLPSKPPPGPLARVRRAAAEIGPETIEKIAERVAALMRHQPPDSDARTASPTDGLIDAEALARHLGVTRAWVYEHANELGAIRIGTGPRARLRFDLHAAREALTSTRQDGTRAPEKSHPGRPRRRTSTSSVPLLPVHEPRIRGILSRFTPARRRGG